MGARVWEVPRFAASWLSLCWLCSSVSLHFTCFPAFRVLVYEVWGLSFIPIHASIFASLTEKWEAAESRMSLLPQSVQWIRGDFSPLYTRSPCDRRPARWTSAPERCCHYPPPAAQAGLAPAKSEDSRLVRQEMLLQGFCGDRSGRWETTNKRPTPG